MVGDGPYGFASLDDFNKCSPLVGDGPWDCCIVNDGCTPQVGDGPGPMRIEHGVCTPQVGDE